MALAVVVLVGERRERAVDRGEDLRERDRLGRAGEHVAAADAALRAHEPRALHREQDLLEVGLGEVRALRDLLHRRGRVGAVERERQQRARGVVASGRHLHPPMRRTSARVRRRGPARPVTVPPVTTATPVRPDYGAGRRWRHRPGAHRAAPTVPGCPEPARDAATVVLLVLDGLGLGAARTHTGPGCRSSPALDRRRRSPPSRRRPPRRRSRRSPPASRRSSTACSGSGCASTARCSTSCAGPSTRASARPVPRAAPPAVPGSVGAGGDARRVPHVGVHRRAPARRAVPRLEHHRRAGRALPRARRGRRAGRVRVLPGGRHRRARVRARTTSTSRASSRSPTSSSAGCSTRCRPRPRCSSPRTTARCTSATTGTTSRRSVTWSRRAAARVASGGSRGARGGDRRARAAAATRRVRSPRVGDDARGARRRRLVRTGTGPAAPPAPARRRRAPAPRAGRVRRSGDAGGAAARWAPTARSPRRRCWSRSWPGAAGGRG